MKYKTDKRLARWIVILPLLGIVATALILTDLFLKYEKNFFNESLYKSKNSITKQNKLQIQDKVLEVVNYIEASKEIFKNESKEEVRSMVSLAVDVVDAMYKKRGDSSIEEIRKRVIEHLRDVRFFYNNTGYFFVYDLKGNSLLLPPMPHLEGTSLLDIRDARGTYTVKEHLEIVEKSNEGFHEWYWYKPDEIVMKKKIGFIKAHRGLGIYIGTAKHEEDILRSTKKELKKLLADIRFGEKGYIFALDYDGNTISHIKKELIGTNRWNLVSNGEFVVQNTIKGARAAQEGFFMTYLATIDPTTGKSAKKTSFIVDLPELGWVIGAGFYSRDVLKKIELRYIELRDNLSGVFTKIIYTTIVVLIPILIIALLISLKLKNVLKNYQKSLIAKHKQTIEQKEQLAYQVEHDDLTGLPNRTMLTQRLKYSISLSKRDKREIAIMFIDIDNFKIINDSMGHDVGDTILKEISKRLKNSIRESDTVARFGGDEFVVLIDNYKSVQDIIAVINKIQDSTKEPIELDESEYKTSLSIGISIFPDDGEDSQSLFKNADIAMYKAKESGKDAYRFFAKQMNDEIKNRLEITSFLEAACREKEFVLHYQPLVDVGSNKIVGVEALIRWQHPTQGLLYPDKFIAIAEESTLIVEIGKWVIDESLRQIVEWKKSGYSIEKISINISSRQLESSGLIAYIDNALKEASCKAEWLEIEVVESYVMKNPKKSIKTLDRLRAMGIDIAIDDFGTGYSSLSYLRDLPVTKLKIDRAFIKNLDNSFEDRAIAKTIIALGSGLMMKVLAEGVETIEQKIFLKERGCSLMQGYLFSKPLPINEVEKLLQNGSTIKI